MYVYTLLLIATVGAAPRDITRDASIAGAITE
jgi:hypothetical protein